MKGLNMRHLSRALSAAIRAIQGESDLETMRPALDDWHLTKVIAFAPDADSIISALAALLCGWTKLLDTSTLANPALHNAVARLIGTNAGYALLVWWAYVAPEGWGTAHADELLNAVKRRTCHPRVAAALIGPCDTSARLLDSADDIASAVCSWGQSTPDNPTAWMNALSSRERDRLIIGVQYCPYAAARCLPWLPPNTVHQMLFDESFISAALAAFVVASQTARTLHADLLQRLVAQSNPKHLGDLTLLACATTSEEVWTRVQALIQEAPGYVHDVVIAARWNALAETVRTALLEPADQFDLRVAIAAARGRKVVKRITSNFAADVFFAALDPTVWDALSSDEQRQWLDRLEQDRRYACLAVESLGLRPDILVRAEMTNNLVHAAHHHARNAAMLRWALLPVVLRDIPPDTAHALIAALPTLPPDPGAFFGIAGAHADPSIIDSRRVRTTLHALDDLACTVVLQRCAGRSTSIRVCCMALQDALCRRTWEDLSSMMALLDDNAHTTMMPDRDALVERLAHPDRKETLHHALDRLASLPPEVAIPSFVALMQSTPQNRLEAGEAIADSLRDHGDLFLMVIDSLTDGCRTTLLPLPDDAAPANALRALARDDPPSALRLARALRNADWRAASKTVLSLPLHHRTAWTPATDALVERFAHPDRREALRLALGRLESLSTDVNLLVRFALDMGTNRDRIEAAGDIARALRGHGDVFLAIVDALKDDRRTALLPLPRHADQANALRDLARDDPLTAHRLAHALCSREWRTALHALLHTSSRYTDAVWQALNESDRREIVARVATVWSDADPIVSRHPLIALALAAIQSDDPDLQHAGIATLEACTDIVRVIWRELPQATQRYLLTHPSLAPSVADFPQPHDHTAIQRMHHR